MLGLVRASAGSVVIGGEDVSAYDQRQWRGLRRRGVVQYVFQDPLRSLDPDLTIETSLAEPLLIGGVPFDEAAARVRAFVPRVRLCGSSRTPAARQLRAHAARRARRPGRTRGTSRTAARLNPTTGRNPHVPHAPLRAAPVRCRQPGQHRLWKDPRVPKNASIDINYYIRQAQAAEHALFDALFIVDSQFINATHPAHYLNRLEPLTLLSAVATHTRYVGLVGTASSTYNSPFNLARRFASLDHISGGRAGWNVVTSFDTGASRNFGLDSPRRAAGPAPPKSSPAHTAGKLTLRQVAEPQPSWKVPPWPPSCPSPEAPPPPPALTPRPGSSARTA